MKKFILLFILFISCKVCSQWTALSTSTSQNLNAVHFINLQTGFAAGVNGTVIKTTDAGTNWITLNTGSSVELRAVYFLNSSTGFVCGFNGTILRTTNGGNNWSAVSSGSSDHLLGLSFYNETIGICTGNTGTTLYTTNGGLNWLEGQPSGFLVTFYAAFMLNASTGFCAGVNTIFSPLWAKTTNGGADWVYGTFMLNNNEGTLRDIHFFDAQTGIAVSNLWNNQGAVSRTTNGGVNWTTQIFQYGLFGLDFPSPLIGYAAGFNGFVYKSTDGGVSWVQQTSNTAAFLKSVDFVDSVNGYISGDGGVILKTTNGGITAVTNIETRIPSEYKLYQNYPNPFNPVTKIRFELPYKNNVEIKIFNVLGQEIVTLVNGILSEGFHEFTFDGSNLSSGIYFYRLKTDTFVESKKMLLIK